MPLDTEKLGPEAQYQSALEKGQFQLQHCLSCSQAVFPPRVICTQCGSAELEWRPVSGEGTIYSCTTVRMVPKGEAPYNVSLVDLDAGARMMSTIPDIPADTVRIGMRVRARVALSEKGARVVFDVMQETAS